MKSEIVMNMESISREEKARYSDLQVLQSPAGFYVGTIYTEDDGSQTPGSRDSGYFTDEQLAKDFLTDAIKHNDRANLRSKP